MKKDKVFLVATDSGYWGKGYTMEEAMNNAYLQFKNDTAIMVFYHSDGSEITQEEYDSIGIDGLRMVAHNTMDLVNLGMVSLMKLNVVSSPDAISERFVDITEEHRKEWPASVRNNLDRVLEAIDTTVF